MIMRKTAIFWVLVLLLTGAVKESDRMASGHPRKRTNGMSGPAGEADAIIFLQMPSIK